MRSAIGILGGMGPSAGVDLLKKIIDMTPVSRDQDHIPVVLYSLPSEIPGRPEYLQDKKLTNPGFAMGHLMVEMARQGVRYIGIPCNTAHSPEILDEALAILKQSGEQAELIHIFDAETNWIKRNYPNIRRIGILCTFAAYHFQIFQKSVAFQPYELVFSDRDGCLAVQDAISNAEFGVKVQAHPVDERAKNIIHQQMLKLIQDGAELILLACSELPLAVSEPEFQNIPVLDCTHALAEALIQKYKNEAAG